MKIRSIGQRRLSSITRAAAFAIGMLLIGTAVTASAQSIARATVDFPFMAGSKQCAAGDYNIEINGPKVTLQPKDGKGTQIVMMVITRLGRHDTDTDTELVFDKVKESFVLAEIWIGNNDGYLVASTPGEHEHRVIGGSKPHR
ncbi:MAG: hypothetical protein WCP29_12880 [Acidobacteriota bacterium]